jgi:RNA polymerase sigma-32 factor
MLQISKPSCTPEHGLNASAMMLVESHIPFARRAASKASRNSGVPFDDLFSAACLGLTDAAPTFDPERGFAFATYALRPVMTRLRDECQLLASVVKRARPVRTDADPGELKPSLAALHVSVRYTQVTQDTSIDADNADDVVGATSDPETTAADRQQSDQRGALLAAAIAMLKPREQEIITARHGDDEPATLGDLATRFGISAERVRQIESASLDKIRHYVRNASGQRPAHQTGYDRQIAAMRPAKEATDNILRHCVIGSFGMDRSPEYQSFVTKMRMAAQ